MKRYATCFMITACLALTSLAHASTINIVAQDGDAAKYAESIKANFGDYLKSKGFNVTEQNNADYTLRIGMDTRFSSHVQWWGITYMPWTLVRPTAKMTFNAKAFQGDKQVWTKSENIKARAAYFKGVLQNKNALVEKGAKNVAPDLLNGFVSQYK